MFCGECCRAGSDDVSHERDADDGHSRPGRVRSSGQHCDDGRGATERQHGPRQSPGATTTTTGRCYAASVHDDATRGCQRCGECDANPAAAAELPATPARGSHCRARPTDGDCCLLRTATGAADTVSCSSNAKPHEQYKRSSPGGL